MSSDADTDAGAVCIVFRVSEHDRISRGSVPVAARHLGEGPVLYSSGVDGNFDVPVVMDRNEKCSAQSASEDDELYVPGNDDVYSCEHGFGLELVLHCAEHGIASAAMAACS